MLLDKKTIEEYFFVPQDISVDELQERCNLIRATLDCAVLRVPYDAVQVTSLQRLLTVNWRAFEQRAKQW